MRKLLFTLILVLMLPICAAADHDLFYDGGKQHQTEHFTFYIPSDWIRLDNGDSLGFSTNPFFEYSGMSLTVFENDYTSFFSLGHSAIYDFLEAGIMSQFGDIEYTKFDAEKDGTPIRYIQFTAVKNDITMNVVTSFYCVDGYTLSCLTTTIADSSDELLENTQSIMRELYFTDNPPPPVSPDQFSDSDYILVGAGQVYGPDLIEAWIRHSSGYIFIKAYESGTPDIIRNSTISNSVKMLEKLQEMVNDEHVEFEKVFFESHTDLVDLYGNKSTGRVISFNIDRDSVMKINFSNFLPTNLQKIATDWHEHSSMK